MANISILIISLIIFAVSARGLGKAILSRRHHFPFLTGYSSAALQLERAYKLMAYGFLTVFSFVTLSTSFYQVLMGMPF
jgi:hypothetical protein